MEINIELNCVWFNVFLFTMSTKTTTTKKQQQKKQTYFHLFSRSETLSLSESSQSWKPWKIWISSCPVMITLGWTHLALLPLGVRGRSELQRAGVDVKSPQLCGQRGRHQLIILRKITMEDSLRCKITGMLKTINPLTQQNADVVSGFQNISSKVIVFLLTFHKKAADTSLLVSENEWIVAPK